MRDQSLSRGQKGAPGRDAESPEPREGVTVIQGAGWPKVGVSPRRVKKVFPGRGGPAWRIPRLVGYGEALCKDVLQPKWTGWRECPHSGSLVWVCQSPGRLVKRPQGGVTQHEGKERPEGRAASPGPAAAKWMSRGHPGQWPAVRSQNSSRVKRALCSLTRERPSLEKVKRVHARGKASVWHQNPLAVRSAAVCRSDNGREVTCGGIE